MSIKRKIFDSILVIVCIIVLAWGSILYSCAKQSKSYNVVLEINKGWIQAVGSGVVISKDGYILTAGHCVEGVESVKVIFANGDEYCSTELYADANDDIGIIKISLHSDNCVELSDSEELEPWDIIYNIGNKWGVWDASISWGLVYKTHFQRIVLHGDSEFIFARMNAVAGCSGGGVYHYRRLIGILSMAGPGCNFIVPSNRCKEFYEEVRDRIENRVIVEESDR